MNEHRTKWDDPEVKARFAEKIRESWKRRREIYGPGGRRDCPGKAEMKRRAAIKLGEEEESE